MGMKPGVVFVGEHTDDEPFMWSGRMARALGVRRRTRLAPRPRRGVGRGSDRLRARASGRGAHTARRLRHPLLRRRTIAGAARRRPAVGISALAPRPGTAAPQGGPKGVLGPVARCAGDRVARAGGRRSEQRCRGAVREPVRDVAASGRGGRERARGARVAEAASFQCQFTVRAVTIEEARSVAFGVTERAFTAGVDGLSDLPDSACPVVGDPEPLD
jgi:hypothetical protein